MEITIKGEAKEIAALVLAVQERLSKESIHRLLQGVAAGTAEVHDIHLDLSHQSDTVSTT